MSAAELEKMRAELKNYIDHADEDALKSAHEILDPNQSTDWWDNMPANVKADLEESIAQADRGEVMTHEQVKKKYPQWFMK